MVIKNHVFNVVFDLIVKNLRQLLTLASTVNLYKPNINIFDSLLHHITLFTTCKNICYRAHYKREKQNANKFHDHNINILLCSKPFTSPYPTVAKVVTAQYTAVMYIVALSVLNPKASNPKTG